MTMPAFPATGSTSWRDPWAQAVHNAAAEITQGRLTDTNLRAAFGGAPAYAGSRTRRFDPERSVYNLKASNTRRLRAKLAAAKAGTGLCHIACAGDSLTAGYGATPGVSGYPSVLRSLLATLGYPTTGTGLVPLYNAITHDPQWTYGGGWTGATLTQPFQSTYSSGQTATFTSTAAGTVVEIVSFGVTTAFNYTIDGGSAQTFTPNGASAVQLLTVTGLANTTHTVAITSTSAAGTFLISAGVRGTSGVYVSNYGLSGSKTTDWTVSSNAWLNPESSFLGARSNDAVLLELGINDAGNAVALSTYQTGLTQLVTDAQATGADVLLAVSNPSDTGTITQATWSSYTSRIYDVADARDVPVLDLTDRYGTYTQTNTNGLMADVTHLNAAGYADKARAWANVLTA